MRAVAGRSIGEPPGEVFIWIRGQFGPSLLLEGGYAKEGRCTPLSFDSLNTLPHKPGLWSTPTLLHAPRRILLLSCVVTYDEGEGGGPLPSIPSQQLLPHRGVLGTPQDRQAKPGSRWMRILPMRIPRHGISGHGKVVPHGEDVCGGGRPRWGLGRGRGACQCPIPRNHNPTTTLGLEGFW